MFNLKDTNQPLPKEEQDNPPKVWTERIYKFLRSKKFIAPKSSKTILRWDKMFRTLLNTHDITTIERVVNGYIKNNKSMPKITSPESFHINWDRMIDTINEIEGSVEISDFSKKTALSISSNLKLFPIEIQTQLSQIVHLSVENWKKFSLKISIYIRRNQRSFILDKSTKEICKIERNIAFLQHVKTHYCNDLINEYFTMLNLKYSNMKHFLGKPHNLAFSADSMIFRQSIWQDWSNRWSGSPTSFNDLLSEVLEIEN